MEDLRQQWTISDFSGSKLFQEIEFLEEGDLNSGFEERNTVFANDVMFITIWHMGAGLAASIRIYRLISYLPKTLIPPISYQKLLFFKAER